MKNEIWKPIPKYEGYYAASDQGRIKSLERIITYRNGNTKTIHERILRPIIHSGGYLQVNLWRNHKTEVRTIHSLVAEAFLGPCPDGKEICHNNGHRDDNRLANLRYDTRSANALDRTKHGNNHCRNRTHCPRGHALIEPNLVRTRAKQGHRRCLACQRAHGYIYHHPELKSHLKRLADEYYSQIINQPKAA